MIWNFEELQDMKEFAKYLSLELSIGGFKDLATEVDMYSYNSYTTSSEYFGEFRIVLKKVFIEVDSILEKNTGIKNNILCAIEFINKAFNK